MKPIPTRTLNPLPFQDLEPHRFEDLVRQLAYDLRTWKSLEAVGRGGSDDGLDIRGIELIQERIDPELLADDEEDSQNPVQPGPDRLWIFQCKREKSLSSSKIKAVIGESLRSLEVPPYGFVLAVACDVSKKSRDAFREEMVARNIENFALWAKSELEDMLFQSHNDRLLFAYFGISIQQRKRSLSTEIRSEIAIKKQLKRLIDGSNGHEKMVLIRDPSDDRYPRKPNDDEPPARWFVCELEGLQSPKGLLVKYREHLAYASDKGDHWDAIQSFDVFAHHAQRELESKRAWAVRDDENKDESRLYYDFWNEYVCGRNRVNLLEHRKIPLDRIIAIDVLADGYYPLPQIYVQFDPTRGPFTEHRFLHLVYSNSRNDAVDIVPTEENRVQFFPNPLPGNNSPVPPQFNQQISQAAELDPSTVSELSSFFDVGVASKQVHDESNSLQELDERNAIRLQHFKNWQDTVALPILSAFAAKLQSEGHWARVVTKVSDDVHLQSAASVALRVKVHKPTRYNQDYWAEGYISISTQSLTNSNSLKVDMSPPLRDARGVINRDQKVVDSISDIELQSMVMAMLKRIFSGEGW